MKAKPQGCLNLSSYLKNKLLLIFIDFAQPTSRDSSESKSFGHDLLSLKFELLQVFVCLWYSKFKTHSLLLVFIGS
jgi:hypothetical protein